MAKTKSRAPTKRKVSTRKAVPVTAKKIVRLREKFAKVHKKGVSALEKGDFNALSDAIKAERDIIDKQKHLIEENMRHPMKRDE